jgi:hypothetical protein
VYVGKVGAKAGVHMGEVVGKVGSWESDSNTDLHSLAVRIYKNRIDNISQKS